MIKFIALIATALSSISAIAPLVNNELATVQPGEYIVVLKMPNFASSDSDKEQFVNDHLQRAFGLYSQIQGNDNPVMFKYSFGYAAKIQDELLNKIREMPEIDFVQPNYIGQIFDTQTRPKNWGLARISQRALGRLNAYNYPSHAGQETTVYIIDTGVDTQHYDFQKGESSRARFGFSAYPGIKGDDHGHGTHVGTTVGGQEFGVSKNSEVVGVKVCNYFGSCPTSHIIAGIEFSVKDHKSSKKDKKKFSIANMSLGFMGKDAALEKAMKSATEQGILFAVAAGNSASNACKFSPAQFDFVVTVGASDSKDSDAYFTNYGPCVDIYAPGVNILAGKPNNEETLMSGTSMASPFVAGALSLLLNEVDPNATQQEVFAELLKRGTPDVLRLTKTSKNLLLYVQTEN